MREEVASPSVTRQCASRGNSSNLPQVGHRLSEALPPTAGDRDHENSKAHVQRMATATPVSPVTAKRVHTVEVWVARNRSEQPLRVARAFRARPTF